MKFKWHSSYTVIAVILLWMIPLAVNELWKWFGLVLTIAVNLAFWEFISIKRDGVTLSDKLTGVVKTNPKTGWTIIVCMAIGWMLLTFVHLPFGV